MIFHFCFVGINVLFFVFLLFWILGVFGIETKTAEETAAQATVGTMGIWGILWGWVLLALPFGILSYITRPKGD